MKLPNAENAIVAERKITRYLLDLDSENGYSKARFFLAFGFKPDDWQVMATALIEHASNHEISRIDERPPFGVHYIIEGSLNTPDGRNPSVRVIWIIDSGDDIPRLVSAYPMSGD